MNAVDKPACKIILLIFFIPVIWCHEKSSTPDLGGEHTLVWIKGGDDWCKVCMIDKLWVICYTNVSE